MRLPRPRIKLKMPCRIVGDMEPGFLYSPTNPSYVLTLYLKMTTFDLPERGENNNTFKSIVGNAGNKHFLLFSHCFPPCPRETAPFEPQ